MADPLDVNAAAACASAPAAAAAATARPAARRITGTSIESLRLERTHLQQALRASRDEIAKLHAAAEVMEAESGRALESAGRAAGLPGGSGELLRQHAASARTIGELHAAVREGEKRERRYALEATNLRAQVYTAGI